MATKEGPRKQTIATYLQEAISRGSFRAQSVFPMPGLYIEGVVVRLTSGEALTIWRMEEAISLVFFNPRTRKQAYRDLMLFQ